ALPELRREALVQSAALGARGHLSSLPSMNGIVSASGEAASERDRLDGIHRASLLLERVDALLRQHTPGGLERRLHHDDVGRRFGTSAQLDHALGGAREPNADLRVTVEDLRGGEALERDRSPAPHLQRIRRLERLAHGVARSAEVPATERERSPLPGREGDAPEISGGPED